MLPSVFVGPNSCRLGQTISNLLQSRGYDGTDQSIYIDSNQVMNSDKGIFTWQIDCGTNKLYQVSADITQRLIRIFDKLDSCPNFLVIVADLGEGFTSSLLSSLLQNISRSFPSISIILQNMTPPGVLHGINSINAALCCLYSLKFCQGITFRDYKCASVLLSNENGKNKGVELKDMNNLIACDYLSLFNIHAIDDFGALDFLHSNCKIFDVRSSLWRALRQESKSSTKTKSEYNSIRAMATNIHSLHASHSCPALLIDCQTISRGSNYYSLTLSKLSFLSKYSESSILPSPSDIKVALDWASPNMAWENLRIISPPQRNSSNTILGDGLSSSKLVNTRAVPEKSQKNNEISVLAFESFYGKAVLGEIVLRTTELIQKSAFIHRFTEHGITALDLIDACDELTTYLSL